MIVTKDEVKALIVTFTILVLIEIVVSLLKEF